MLAMMLNNPIKWNISADLWKKTFPNWLFSYWNIIEKDTFGSSERLPPLSGALPTNKNTYPPIRKPPPIHSVFFLFAWLPLQLLSFGQTTLACTVFPTSLVPEVPCGLAHHVDMKWLAFTSRAVLPLGPSCTIANQTGSRGSLWLGSSCWYEMACFHFKSCASIGSKLHYCQPD